MTTDHEATTDKQAFNILEKAWRWLTASDEWEQMSRDFESATRIAEKALNERDEAIKEREKIERDLNTAKSKFMDREIELRDELAAAYQSIAKLEQIAKSLEVELAVARNEVNTLKVKVQEFKKCRMYAKNTMDTLLTIAKAWKYDLSKSSASAITDDYIEDDDDDLDMDDDDDWDDDDEEDDNYCEVCGNLMEDCEC